MPVDPSITGPAERALAALWMTSVRAPEVHERYDALGLTRGERYFPARAAPLGPAPVALVVSTFFNFSPAAVSRALPGAWEKASPAQILEAQRGGVADALHRALAPVDRAVVTEATTLVRSAAEAAAGRPEGRPLFSGYAALPWPDDPVVVLWHGHYLLREFRGDGHIAALLTAGLTGIEALAIHVAELPALGRMLRETRAWTDAEWGAALERLRAAGWLTDADPPELTAEGAAWREAIERRTDALAVPAYAPLGQDGCERLVELGGPIGAALADAGLGRPSA